MKTAEFKYLLLKLLY